MPQIAVIIPAAGQSTRFGGVEKKTFVSLAGRPVWLRTAEMFWSRDDVSRVYLVIAPGDREEFWQRFGHLLAFVNAEVVDGGAERFESVAHALRLIPDSVDFVAVHDAVRPLITQAAIDHVFAAAAEHGAAMLAIPVADTLKRVDPANSRIVGTVARAGLWQAQTPQIFRRDWLAAAYAMRSSLEASITDDAQLVEALGHLVVVVPGSLTNFKITNQADLTLAEAVLQSRASKATAKIAPRFGDEAEW